MKKYDGKASFYSEYPNLAKDWDYKNNAPLTPHDVLPHSNKKVWWRCDRNHSYLCTIDKRSSRNQGCPYCSGKRILTGYNDLLTLNPQLAEEWNTSRNLDISVNSISPKSSKKVWWKCKSCGHEWQTTPNDRSSGKGCPECAKSQRAKTRLNTMLLKNMDNTLDNNVDLMKEWDYHKNSIDPSKVLSGSSTKVWWICSVCGNSWNTSVSNRTRGSGCPKCMKHNRTSFPEQALYYYLSKVFGAVINSYTDVFDNRMELDIYVPEIRTGFEYDGIAFHSGTKAEQEMVKKYDICKDNSITLIRISEFKNNTPSYDHCFIRTGNTDSELTAVITDVIRFVTNSTISIDVVRDRPSILKQYITVIREKSISYRYPEVAKKWDFKKNKGLRPDQVNAYSNKKYWWMCPRGHSYQATPENEVNNTKSCPICSNHRVLSGYNDLATKLPELAKEWDEDLNTPLTASDVLFTSSKKYWWKCPQGHSYLTGINNRYYGKTGCPYCSNNKVLTGFNDLKTVFPELAKEWDQDKNGSLLPSEVLSGSNRKVWWVCSTGHEWKATIGSRSGKEKIGCPYCSNHKVLQGFNDLATTHPRLLEEWNYEKNKDVNPTEIVAGSPRKVWWICKVCGNEWKTGVALRTGNQKTGCPICGYKFRQQNTNIERIKRLGKTLSLLFPELAAEWDYKKNTMRPDEVSPGSNIKVWWICPQGHSYQSWLCDRSGPHKVGCPVCSRKRLLSGVNDLETLFPDIADEWDYDRNGALRPSDITAQNGKKVWWKCKNGHSWEATVSARTGKNKTGCPYCRNKRVLSGYNDLETKYPELCKEWDYDKNDIHPSDIVFGSGKLVWWKCSAGHEWQAKIVNRVRGSGCLECYNLRRKKNNR